MPRVTEALPPEPKEIKPHPYGVELGMLVAMLKETKAPTVSQFLTHSFSRVSPAVARKICEAAKLSTRANPQKCGRHEADRLYQAIQQTKISAPATDCIAPIGEELILTGLHQVVPGEFYAAATPAAGGLSRQSVPHRGRPGLRRRVVGARRSRARPCTSCSKPSDARTLRQFLSTTFDGVGAEAADKILHEAGLRHAVVAGQARRRPKSPSSTRPCGTSTCTTASR